MPSVPNPRITLAKLPETVPVPGEHLVYDDSRTIDIDNVPLNGGFLTKLLIISPEPYLRGRMRENTKRSYMSAMVLGAPVTGSCVVKVIRSEKEGVEVGTYMYGMTHWELYTVQPYIEGRNTAKDQWHSDTFDADAMALRPVPDPKGTFPLSRYTNILGTPGLSAYMSFESMSEGKEGETCFVSSGASGVGSLVVQLAKLRGMKVIASAGSDAKVDYCRSIGADYAFNYKKESYKDALTKAGPIDVYYDNVGGVALEEAINASNIHGRIIICGQVSEYNTPFEQRYGIKNTVLFFERRLTMKGYLVADFIPTMMEDFLAKVPALVAEGKLTSQETSVKGIENAAQAFVDMLHGKVGDDAGKPVVIVSED